MSKSLLLKEQVRNKYADIAVKAKNKCCSCGCEENSILKEDYSRLEGYVSDADLALGCGIPTKYAGIKKGDTIVDLGSGAGNDVFIARTLTGESGFVYGIDMTQEMIDQAHANQMKLGFNNIKFKKGDIESMPLESNIADVVLSNCVLNLVPDKKKAFEEIFRIIKPGGHFCISDLVSSGSIPESLKTSAELYAGCVSGAIEKSKYLQIISNAGFINVYIPSSNTVDLPDDLLKASLNAEEYNKFLAEPFGIFSITVTGYKPV
jgi:SAM-dependent methyltransferase